MNDRERFEKMKVELNPIVVVDENTYVYGAWIGSAGPDASVHCTLYRMGDGTLLATGRIRTHVDDKVLGSADTKDRFELRAKKGANVKIFQRRATSRIRSLVKSLGSAEDARDLTWVKVNGDAEVMIRALESHALKDDRFSLGVTSFGE